MTKQKYYIGPDGDSVLTVDDMRHEIDTIPWVDKWSKGNIEIFKSDCTLLGEFNSRSDACIEACRVLEINHMDN